MVAKRRGAGLKPAPTFDYPLRDDRGAYLVEDSACGALPLTFAAGAGAPLAGKRALIRSNIETARSIVAWSISSRSWGSSARLE